MADDVKKSERSVEAASAAPGEKRSAGRPLAKASEAGDPAVQKLLADKWTAQQWAAQHKDTADRSAAERKGHEDQVAALDAELAELGFE
jgi:hypothetical protein